MTRYFMPSWDRDVSVREVQEKVFFENDNVLDVVVFRNGKPLYADEQVIRPMDWSDVEVHMVEEELREWADDDYMTSSSDECEYDVYDDDYDEEFYDFEYVCGDLVLVPT